MNETQLPCDPVDTKEDIPLGNYQEGTTKELPRYREKELPVRACRSCVSTFLISFVVVVVLLFVEADNIHDDVSIYFVLVYRRREPVLVRKRVKSYAMLPPSWKFEGKF